MVELFRDFKVNERHITVTFNVSEYDNDNEIEGIFYHEELLPTLDSGNYIITILKHDKKTKKKTEYSVNYEDFSNSNPAWID